MFYFCRIALFSAVCFQITTPETVGPQIFAPGVVSTGHEFGITFTPDGKESYFSRFESKHIHIFHTVMAGGLWQRPERVSFSSDQWSDLDPFLSRHGKKLFFVSTRPAPRAAIGSKNMDIWVSTMESGHWGEPRWIEEVNSVGKEGSPCVDGAGNLYFFSDRVGGADHNRIYEAPLVNGAYVNPVPLPEIVNSGPSDTSPFISPDGNSLLFYSTRPGGFGKADLYIAFRKHGKWTTVRNLGPQINSPDSEYNPAISPDGKTLFFGRNSNIYEVPIKAIHTLKSSLFR
jgi:Tol biopolymer transport system component